jgi:hypothetical protein
MRAPNMKYYLAFGLVLAFFGIVPVVAILFKYNAILPISSLSVDYWLWLCVDAAGWLLIAMLRFFPDSIADAFTRAFTRVSRSSTVWIFSAIVFAASAVEGIFTGRFLSLAPAIMIADVGFIALTSTGFRRKPKG